LYPIEIKPSNPLYHWQSFRADSEYFSDFKPQVATLDWEEEILFSPLQM
jgi:hypothetical protein